jgi:hypothetical protein
MQQGHMRFLGFGEIFCKIVNHEFKNGIRGNLGKP